MSSSFTRAIITRRRQLTPLPDARSLRLLGRRRPRSGPRPGAGVVRILGPRSFASGPVGQTKMCTQALLRARPPRWVPGALGACSSATNTFEAALEARWFGEGRRRGVDLAMSTKDPAKYRPQRPQ